MRRIVWMFAGLAVCLAAGTAAAQPAQPAAQPAQPAAQPAQPAPASPASQAPGQVSAPAGEALSLADAERVALSQSPELAISRKSVDVSQRRLQGARAQRLPRLSVEASVSVFTEEQAIPNFFMPEGPPIVLREQVTTNTTATLVQPLTPQIALGELVEVEKAGVSASKEEHRSAELEVGYRATDGYLLVLLAQSGREVAAQRVAQFEAQLARARVLVEGGVLQPVDAMRLEAALSSAQRDLLTAESQVRLAKNGLILALGVPTDTNIEVRDDLPVEPKAPPATVNDAVATATDKRPDLRAATFRAAQAESGAAASRAALIPTVAAIGVYQYSPSTGALGTPHTAFVGLTLQWNVWDWGQTWQSYKGAELQAVQAEMAAARAVDRVRLEVSAAASDAQSAYEALAVVRVGLAAAEEAFRIQNDRFNEGVATTTDVLDAQTEVTQARLGYASTRYAYFRALASLARATGQLPSALLSAI
jgi:outer membrane protein TolC